MKKFFIFLVFFSFLMAEEAVNMVVLPPKISGANVVVKKAIEKGYNRQLEVIIRKIKPYKTLHLKRYIKIPPTTNNEFWNKIFKADNEAIKEWLDFIEFINEKYQNDPSNKNVVKSKQKKVSLSDEDEDIGFLETPKIKLKTDNVNYGDLFLNRLEFVKNIYSKLPNNEDGKFPYYLDENSLKFGKLHYYSPNIFFAEYFFPYKRGVRYFLNINIFMFKISKQGVVPMIKEVRNFSWKRNYRFISAQTNRLITETISQMTGISVK